jgi:hypothetical protein
MTGDNTRRYIGSIRALASGTIVPFKADAEGTLYEYIVSQLLVYDGVPPAAETTVNLGVTGTSPLHHVPNTSGRALIRIAQSINTTALLFGHPEDGIALGPSNYLTRVPAEATGHFEVELDSQQRFTWMRESATTNTVWLNCGGYHDAR